jgi:Acetyltransferase (GNAT) family
VTVSLSVNIVHVPWDAQRRAWVAQQREALQGLPVAVIEDTERQGLWPTQRRAWLHGLETGTSHVMALADDMLPVDDFVPRVLAALQALEDHKLSVPVCLFSMRGTVRVATEQGKAWTASPDGIWGGAGIVPRTLLADWLPWVDQHVRPDYPWDDRRLTFYLRAHGRGRIWQTVPCLLEHAGASTSTLGLNNRRRVASRLAQPGEAIDWTAGITTPHRDGGCLNIKAEWRKAAIDPETSLDNLGAAPAPPPQPSVPGLSMHPILFGQVRAALGETFAAEAMNLHPAATYIGGFIDGALIGTVAYTLTSDGRKATLVNDLVKPEWRGRGVYRALNAYRLRHLRQLGVRSAGITCTPSSFPLHEHAGARLVQSWATARRLVYDHLP